MVGNVVDTVKSKVQDLLPSEAHLGGHHSIGFGKNKKKNQLAAQNKRKEIASYGPLKLSCYKCFYGARAGIGLEMTVATTGDSPYIELESMEVRGQGLLGTLVFMCFWGSI